MDAEARPVKRPLDFLRQKQWLFRPRGLDETKEMCAKNNAIRKSTAFFHTPLDCWVLLH